MASCKHITHLSSKGKRLPDEEHLQRGKAARDAGDFSQAVWEFEQVIAPGLAGCRLVGSPRAALRRAVTGRPPGLAEALKNEVVRCQPRYG
jgi:hypothetical protein